MTTKLRKKLGMEKNLSTKTVNVATISTKAVNVTTMCDCETAQRKAKGRYRSDRRCMVPTKERNGYCVYCGYAVYTDYGGKVAEKDSSEVHKKVSISEWHKGDE